MKEKEERQTFRGGYKVPTDMSTQWKEETVVVVVIAALAELSYLLNQRWAEFQPIQLTE